MFVSALKQDLHSCFPTRLFFCYVLLSVLKAAAENEFSQRSLPAFFTSNSMTDIHVVSQILD